MEPKHTPGPWRALHRHSCGKATDEIGGLGWDIFGPPEPMLRGQFAKAADAHLVAAAPELLAACEAALAIMDGAIGIAFPEEKAQLAAAIRKAKGEADG